MTTMIDDTGSSRCKKKKKKKNRALIVHPPFLYSALFFHCQNKRNTTRGNDEKYIYQPRGEEKK